VVRRPKAENRWSRVNTLTVQCTTLKSCSKWQIGKDILQLPKPLQDISTDTGTDSVFDDSDR